MVILVLLILYALYSYGVRRGGTFAVLIGVGYGIAFLSGGSGLGSRVVSAASETPFGVRPRVWLAGARYVLHHPLLGVGPGQFRDAVNSTATLSFFQNVLSGRILTDGHDIFVEVVVTTGLLGLVCFLVWLLGAARTAARCTFLGFAAAMIAVALVEPMNVAVLPLAFLGLGAATAVRLRHGETAGLTSCQPASEQPRGVLPANEQAPAPYCPRDHPRHSGDGALSRSDDGDGGRLRRERNEPEFGPAVQSRRCKGREQTLALLAEVSA